MPRHRTPKRGRTRGTDGRFRPQVRGWEAEQDASRIARIERRLAVARMAAGGLGGPRIGEVLGFSTRRAQVILRDAIEGVAGMPDEDRQEARGVPPPAAVGTRDNAVLELRKRSLSYREIADELGIPETTAQAICAREIGRLSAEETRSSDLARLLELDRLDAIGRVLWPKVLNGDGASIDRYLKLMERRSRYLGLDAATRVDIEERLRQAAREEGLDEETVIHFARRLKARAGTR